MANKFSVDAIDIMPGLQMLGGAIREGKKTRADYERARVKEEKERQFGKEMENIITTGTPEEIMEFRSKNPSKSKDIESAYKFKNDLTKENKINTAMRIINGEDPAQAEMERADFVLEQGGEIGDTLKNTYTAMAEPPEKAKDRAWKDLARLLEPNKFKEIRGAYGAGDVAEDKTEKLKLTQLINKRNELPEGSEDRGIYEKAIQKEIESGRKGSETKLYPFISRLMADGWLPSGRITGPMLTAFEAAAEKANEMGKDLTVKDLRKMEFEATKNRASGASAGSRLVISRKQNIEAAQSLLKDLKKTSAKLNYSPVKFISSLEKWKNKELVDPLFTEYMTQRADSLFVLGNALKQNGLTDKSIEVEEEAFSPTLSPKAFDGWYNTQVRALNMAAHEMNKDYGYGITLMPAFDAGQAGAPTKEQPNPVVSVPGQQAEPEITREQYNQLPSGATYTMGGKTYRKK